MTGKAVLVGLTHVDPDRDPNSLYRNGCEKCVQNLQDVGKILSDLGINLVPLPDEAAHWTVVRSHLEDASQLGPDDIFIFYFAGHGIIDGSNQTTDLALFDYNVPIQTVGRLLADVGAGRVISILDCCNSDDILSDSSLRWRSASALFEAVRRTSDHPRLLGPELFQAGVIPDTIRPQIIHYGAARYSTDGGAFTDALLATWKEGFRGGYRKFFCAIFCVVRKLQLPVYRLHGPQGGVGDTFEAQVPFTVLTPDKPTMIVSDGIDNGKGCGC